MKIVFLDVDGVLNSEWSIKERLLESGDCLTADRPHPQHIRFLNRIIEETGAKIVISSCWRLGREVDDLKMQFESYGVLKDSIIDKTPIVKMDRVRGREIEAWMEDHCVEAKDVVILDDDCDMGALLPRLIQTNFRTGLQEEHYSKAVEMLK